MVLIINTYHMGFIGIKTEEVIEYIIDLFYTFLLDLLSLFSVRSIQQISMMNGSKVLIVLRLLNVFYREVSMFGSDKLLIYLFFFPEQQRFRYIF